VMFRATPEADRDSSYGQDEQPPHRTALPAAFAR